MYDTVASRHVIEESQVVADTVADPETIKGSRSVEFLRNHRPGKKVVIPVGIATVATANFFGFEWLLALLAL